MKCELRNVKFHDDMSQETQCFSATLYIDGKKAANVRNDGQGGCHLFDWFDSKLAVPFINFCKAMPATPSSIDGQLLPMDDERYVDQLLNQYEEQKSLKRWCKNQTVFRLKGDKPNSWRIFKIPYDAKVKEKIVATHGDKIERIGNEEIV